MIIKNRQNFKNKKTERSFSLERLEIAIPVGNEYIKGNLQIVPDSTSLVIFAHGSGSGRFSKRNQFVADTIHQGTISTLLFDLLTEQEDVIDQATREFRFDIPRLAERLMAVTQWIKSNKKTAHFAVGYFGSSTGAPAALIAAAQLPKDILAVVSRGGRTDLASDYLANVKAATLFIIGELDYEVIKLNEASYAQLDCAKELYIVPQATHLFEEAGALEQVAKVALHWFKKYLH